MGATATKTTATPAPKPKPLLRSRERQPELPAPDAGLLGLQHVVGNRTISAILSNQHRVHQPQLPPLGSGRPLDPPVQQRLEKRLGNDLGQVRVHTDGPAAESARNLGALAYSTGPDVVFRPGEYQPWTAGGFDLLTHEVAHVVQSGGQPASSFNIESATSPWEHQASQIATSPPGSAAPLTTGAPPAVRLRRDPQLEEALKAIEHAVGPFASTRDQVLLVFGAVKHVDLNDADNLQPITLAVRRRFGDQTMVLFLTILDQMSPQRRIGQPTAAEAQHQQLMRLMQVQRRGPYGTYGGVMLPVATHALAYGVPRAIARAIAALPAALRQLVTMIINLFRSAGAFLSGILAGFNASVSTADAKQLAERMLKSAVMHIIFAPVFLAGTVVGIVEDVVDTVKSIYHLVVNFRETVSGMLELLKALLSSAGVEIAYKIGEEMGKSFAGKIQELLKGGMVRFSYNLGRFVGPTIVYTILAFLGVPELIGASIATKLMSILRPFLQRFPKLMKVLEAIAKRIPHRRHRGPDVDVGPSPRHGKTPELPARHHEPSATPPKSPDTATPKPPSAKKEAGEPQHVATRKRTTPATSSGTPRNAPPKRRRKPAKQGGKPKSKAKKRVRASTRTFLNDCLHRVSDPNHPLHFLVVRKQGPGGSVTYDWRKTTRITKKGRRQTGRYQGNEDGPVVQVGHQGAHASGAREQFTLEDADLNQLGGQTIESKGAFSFKGAIDIDGVPVDIDSALQWERLGLLPKGTVAASRHIPAPEP